MQATGDNSWPWLRLLQADEAAGKLSDDDISRYLQLGDERPHAAQARKLRALLTDVEPTVCVFDRFYTEEAHSHGVRALRPRALRVLDMQDVHALRLARQRVVTRDGGDVAEGAPPPLSEQEWLHALTVLDPRPSAERPAVLDPSI